MAVQPIFEPFEPVVQLLLPPSTDYHLKPVLLYSMHAYNTSVMGRLPLTALDVLEGTRHQLHTGCEVQGLCCYGS